MDATDQKLIALLKQDGRASVTTLAGALRVSRVTDRVGGGRFG